MDVCLLVSAHGQYISDCCKSYARRIFYRNIFRKWISSISCSVREGVGGNHQPQLQATLSNALTLSSLPQSKPEQPDNCQGSNALLLEKNNHHHHNNHNRTTDGRSSALLHRQPPPEQTLKRSRHHVPERQKNPYTSPLHCME